MHEDSKKPSRRSESIGKFEIKKYIARGGMGAVYQALDTENDRIVALKVLPPDLATQPAMLERFRREARAADLAEHENIVALYDAGEVGGTHYLAMEFVEGIDLDDLLRRKKKLTSEEARHICLQAARGLEHLHKIGIVHRDIKPSNFLLALRNGKLVVKLADLGLALQTKEDEFRVTKAGTTVGTVDYMSPEQARNSASADVRSDMYSLGCTFYQMLTGETPFPEGSLAERILKHIEAPPPDPRDIDPTVPAELAGIARKLLAKKPSHRFQTPRELIQALQAASPRRRAAQAAAGDSIVADAPTVKIRKKRPDPEGDAKIPSGSTQEMPTPESRSGTIAVEATGVDSLENLAKRVRSDAQQKSVPLSPAQSIDYIQTDADDDVELATNGDVDRADTEGDAGESTDAFTEDAANEAATSNLAREVAEALPRVPRDAEPPQEFPVLAAEDSPARKKKKPKATTLADESATPKSVRIDKNRTGADEYPDLTPPSHGMGLSEKLVRQLEGRPVDDDGPILPDSFEVAGLTTPAESESTEKPAPQPSAGDKPKSAKDKPTASRKPKPTKLSESMVRDLEEVADDAPPAKPSKKTTLAPDENWAVPVSEDEENVGKPGEKPKRQPTQINPAGKGKPKPARPTILAPDEPAEPDEKPVPKKPAAMTARTPTADATDSDEEIPTPAKKPGFFGQEVVNVVEVDDGPNEPRKPIRGLGIMLIAGGGLLSLIAIVAVMAMQPRPPEPPSVQPNNVDPLPPIAISKKDDTVLPEVKPKVDDQKSKPKDEVPAGPVGPFFADLPKVVPLPPGVDRPELRKEFIGNVLDELVEPASNVKIAQVARTARTGGAVFPTLAEAFAATADDPVAVIEIADQGPIFVPKLPLASGRVIHLRAAQGSRPLVAWEPATPGESTWFSVSRGKLFVSGIDFVARTPPAKSTQHCTLFDMEESDLFIRDCTVSVGRQSAEVVCLRSKPGRKAALSAYKAVFVRSLLRGPDLSAVAVRGTPAEILLDRTLFAGYAKPALTLLPRETDEILARLHRSTLVSSSNLIKVGMADAAKAPRVRAFVLDSILSRNDGSSPEGAMLDVSDGLEPQLLGWRSIGGLYVGWKRLMQTGAGTIEGQDLEAWKTRWGYPSAEASLLQTWPNLPSGKIDDVPSLAYSPFDTVTVLTQAIGSDGAAGATPGLLPPEPQSWIDRTYERAVVPLQLPSEDFATAPPIPESVGGLYAGERVDLSRVPGGDVGKYLQSRLQPGRVADRVVLVLSGRGTHYSSPIQVRDTQECTIYFEQPGDPKAEPLVLEVQPRGFVGAADAFVDVEGGKLVLANARFRLQNSVSSISPRYLVRARNADLVLAKSWLIGPMDRPPAAFQSLVHVNATSPANSLRHVTIVDSVLVSGRSILQLNKRNAALTAHNNLLVSLGVAVQVDLETHTSAPSLRMIFEKNTVALGQGLLSFAATAEGDRAISPARIFANQNAFPVEPFTKQTTSATAATVLRDCDAAISRGMLHWQGKGNLFDKRLGSWIRGPDDAKLAVEAKGALEGWRHLWGQANEQLPAQSEFWANSKTFNISQLYGPGLGAQLRLLASASNVTAGADFARLGLRKK